MKIELIVVLLGLVIFLLFGAARGINLFRGMESEHLLVFRNLGGVLAILGVGLLIFRTFQSFG